MGVSCTIEGDSLRVKGPKSAAALGSEIIARKAEVLAYLAGWNLEVARDLMFEADGTVERLGVSGRDEVISAAADRYIEAVRARDMAGVAAACEAVRARATQLGNENTHRGSL